MFARKTITAAVVAASLAGCSGTGGGIDSSTIGTIGGAAGGALLGSQFGSGTGQIAATAIGTLAGALAGQQIAKRMSASDQQRAYEAERASVRDNQPIVWSNPDTGSRGEIRPVRTYQSDSGRICREYTHTVRIEGRPETARGTACEQPDGTWRLVG
jgi:surface antigen